MSTAENQAVGAASVGAATVSFATVGCKLNFAESATLARGFAADGLRVVPFGEPADVVVINSCTVTENADRDTRKLIRRARRRSPGAFLIVTGCGAQLRPERIASIDGVDLVLGTAEKFRIRELASPYRRGESTRILVGDPDAVADTGAGAGGIGAGGIGAGGIGAPEAAYSADESARTRSFLKVQDGCDYGCAFCTVPLARGGGRSVDAEAALAAAREIIARGFREIVLSGVNVGAYRDRGGTALIGLLERLLALPGGARFRISSIEPNLLGDDIIALAAANDALCPHFHLPLQSGSDAVLRLMRRRYTAGRFRERVERMRELLPQAGIGVDVIVGHPGEGAAQFEETHRFLAELPCSYLHVFSYSERPGTAALALGDRVPHEERARRSALLRALSERKRRAFHASLVGSRQRVLFETGDGEGRIAGFAANYARIAAPDDPALAHALREVRITGVDRDLATGEPLPEPSPPA